MRHMVSMMVMVGWLSGCAGAGNGSGDVAGAGGAGGGAASSSSGADPSGANGGESGSDVGSGGAGGATEGVRFTLSLGELAGCPSARIVGPMLPEEAGAIALGRFVPPRLPATLETFSFVGEPARGQCADMATEVVYWASASAVPEETPAGAHVLAVPSTDGEVSVALDPPLELAEQQPYGFVGVRMAAAGDESACIVACPGGERLDDNWWSSAPAAPFGWDRLADSAPDDEPGTPGDGLTWDYVFSVSGAR